MTISGDEISFKYDSLLSLTDICGIRICTFYSDDVDVISELIKNEFDVDEINYIDKRKAKDPERFGYMSVHYIVSLRENRLALRVFNV